MFISHALDLAVPFNSNVLLLVLVVSESLRSGHHSCNIDVPPEVGTIRNHIRRLRFAHNEMTRRELPEKIALTRQTVNAIELGKYSPPLEAAFKIAAVFNEPLENVFVYLPD